MSDQLARYKCLRCNHQWQDLPGSSSFWTKQEDKDKFCPKCGHLYAKWENYHEFATLSSVKEQGG